MTYESAFALRDNPFGPTQPLPRITRRGVMQMLQSFPLRIHEEPELLALYCSHAGPFDQHTTRFLQEIAAWGYSVDPPSAGLGSLIFLISGGEGTGKTTLAHMMIHWLKKCKSSGGRDWHVFDLSKEFPSGNNQIAEIDKLQERIIKDTSPSDYCCVLLDNLLAGADSRALNMFDELIGSERIVFLFLLTKDLQILNEKRDNSRHQIARFRMRDLTSLDAVAFVKHRIEYYRDPKLPSLSNYNLFPFDEADIKGAVESGMIRGNGNGEGKVTVRQFNVILHRFLIRRMRELDPGFNIAQVPVDDVSKHIISLIKYYQRAVA